MPTLSVEPTLFNITNTDVSYQMTGTYNLSIEPRSFTITDTDAAITKDSSFRIEPRFFRINPQSTLLDYAEPVSSDFLYTIAGGNHHDDIFPYTIHRGDVVPVKIDWSEILDPQESLLTAEVMASGLTATSLTTDGTTTRFILSNVITTSVADVVLKVETSDVRTLVRTIRVRTWYEPDVYIPPAPPPPAEQTISQTIVYDGTYSYGYVYSVDASDTFSENFPSDNPLVSTLYGHSIDIYPGMPNPMTGDPGISIELDAELPSTFITSVTVEIPGYGVMTKTTPDQFRSRPSGGGDPARSGWWFDYPPGPPWWPGYTSSYTLNLSITASE